MTKRILLDMLRDWLRVLLTPRCWTQTYAYSAPWDRELNRLIREDVFTCIGSYTARIGGHKVWVANHPYASYRMENLELRPKRATILRAHDKLVKDAIAQAEEQKERRE